MSDSIEQAAPEAPDAPDGSATRIAELEAQLADAGDRVSDLEQALANQDANALRLAALVDDAAAENAELKKQIEALTPAPVAELRPIATERQFDEHTGRINYFTAAGDQIPLR